MASEGRKRVRNVHYEVDIVPPNGPTVVQVDAAPAGDQGQSTSYSSGFSFTIGGGVSISGEDPGAGFQVGVTWDNETSATVPALVIAAGDMGNQGTFTKYQYCTSGTTVADCVPTIQMTGVSGCPQAFVGQPQQGQTPNGRLSGVAQTVRWQVDPATYSGATFDITVTWQANFAFSQALLWNGVFRMPLFPHDPGQPSTTGYCDASGCNCAIPYTTNPDTHSLTFKVPIPSSSNCPGQ
jgi:hypothetical protein